MPFKQRPPFFLVWNPSTGKTFHRHRDHNRAMAEAQRLANENPGSKFHVLLSLGRCTRDPQSDLEGGE